MEKIKNLTELKSGQEAIIIDLDAKGIVANRLNEMGFIKGTKIKVIRNAPLQDPVEYEVLGYKISLRRNDAKLIKVIEEYDNLKENELNPLHSVENINVIFDKKRIAINNDKKIIKVAIVGNPNTGKTCLFNRIAGTNEKEANYPGVTVEIRTVNLELEKYQFELADLPGIYSLTPDSEDEKSALKYILKENPDIVINVIDSTNLVRNLFLTTELIEMNFYVIGVLNIYDEIEDSDSKINIEELQKIFGIKFIPTVANKGIGVDRVLKELVKTIEESDIELLNIQYNEDIESKIKYINEIFRKFKVPVPEKFERFISLKLLCNHDIVSILDIPSYLRQEIQREIENITEKIDVARVKYNRIDQIIKETTKIDLKYRETITERIDSIVINKLLGLPILMLMMFLMFYATFEIGKYPVGWIETGIEYLANFMNNNLRESYFKDFIIDGVVNGVGSVLVFLPNIIILFFFISLFEDTGYLARAAFIIDKLFSSIGLQGKSLIPLLIGFGCNVPAIIATKNINNRKVKYITSLIIPFMSCPARLPVYVLLVSAFFEKQKGLILFSVYLSGIILAIIMAIILNKFLYKGVNTNFVMELPPYRLPRLYDLYRSILFRSSIYLKKMGTVILFASIIIWSLSYFPKNKEIVNLYDNQIKEIEKSSDFSKEVKEELIAEVEKFKSAELLENSYMGIMGKMIEPVISPLGYDWRIGISLISGLAAKEVIISSMSVLYKVEEEDEIQLSKALKKSFYKNTNNNQINPFMGISLMMFILIYSPCIGVIAAMKKELSTGWAMFSIFFYTILAYIIAFIIKILGDLIV